MKVDNDTKERLKVAALFCLESVKVGMGTFLSYFVPTTTEERPPAFMNAVHAVAMASIAILYTVELKRENFCIHYFDIDPSFPDSHLKSVIPKPLKTKLLTWNKYFWRSAYSSMILTTANLAVSCYYFKDYYAGTSTLTSLLSYTLLVYMKLNRSYALAKSSNKEESARSAYMTEQRAYNTMDKDFKSFDAL
jgi:hypothetical protein